MVEQNPYHAPQAADKPSLEHILYFVWEREAIRIAKENGYKGELTVDPILAKYRFCNIRRRDDRVSKWLIENMYIHIDSEDDAWFIAAIARFINWPPTLVNLLNNGAIPAKAEDFNANLFCRVLDDLTTGDTKVWTGAYMVCTGGKTYPSKAHGIAEFLKNAIHNRETIREAVFSNSVKKTVSAIHNCQGFGTFMAGQITADLTYIHPLDKAKDLHLWAPMGPGSKRGLNRLYGNKLHSSWKQDKFNIALISLRIAIMGQLGIENITLHDVQNCMCEIDKYWRVLYSEGRPRSIYQPETRF